MTAPAVATSDDAVMPDTPALANLRRIARKYARAQAARDKAKLELDQAIRRADREGGHTRNEIIAVAGVTRRTVYLALDGADPAGAEPVPPEEQET